MQTRKPLISSLLPRSRTDALSPQRATPCSRPGITRIALLLVLLAACSLSAQAQVSLSFDPPSPNQLEPVTATLSGTWHNGCVPTFFDLELNGSNLDLIVGLTGGGVGCTAALTAFSTSLELRGLSVGDYNVRAVLPGPFAESTLASATLEVDPSQGSGLDTLSIWPENPGPSDRILISASGIWPDACVPRFADTDVGGGVVNVLTLNNDGPCLDAPTPFDLSALVGPLPAGSYDLNVHLADALALPVVPTLTLLGERSFEVQGPPATVASLFGGRFQVEVIFSNQQGEPGNGRVMEQALPKAKELAASAGESALFWFFSPDNTEMVVKVLDGCPVNNRYWVFASAATDLEFTITVTDTAGFTNTYSNEAATAAQAITDIDAFASCPAS